MYLDSRFIKSSRTMLLILGIVIFEFTFVFNRPIFDSLQFPTKIGSPREASVRCLDTLYNEYEVMWARKKHNIEPIRTRKFKEVTEKEHRSLASIPEDVESVASDSEQENKSLLSMRDHIKSVTSDSQKKHELLIDIPQEGGNVASGSGATLKQDIPFHLYPIIWAMDWGLGPLVIHYYRSKIISEETKVLSSFNEGFRSMSQGNLKKAQDCLKDAVYHDGLSKSKQKTYDSLNGPAITLAEDYYYNYERASFEKIQEYNLGPLHHGLLDFKFNEMLARRRKMEQRWQSGDKRRPDPTNVVLYRDFVASSKQKSVKKITDALAHDMAGLQYLEDDNLRLAKLHYIMAKKLYDEAETEMEKVYGIKFGSVDLALCEDYLKQAKHYDALFLSSNRHKFEGGLEYAKGA